MLPRRTHKVNLRLEDDITEIEEFRVRRYAPWAAQENTKDISDLFRASPQFKIRHHRASNPTSSPRSSSQSAEDPLSHLQTMQNFLERLRIAFGDFATSPATSAPTVTRSSRDPAN